MPFWDYDLLHLRSRQTWARLTQVRGPRKRVSILHDGHELVSLASPLGRFSGILQNGGCESSRCLSPSPRTRASPAIRHPERYTRGRYPMMMSESKYAGMERLEFGDTFHPGNNGHPSTPLLVISFGQLRRNRGQITKQPSRAMVWSRREVYLCGRRGGGIAVIRADISGAECPEAING
jgi:hypothetical protein